MGTSVTRIVLAGIFSLMMSFFLVGCLSNGGSSSSDSSSSNSSSSARCSTGYCLNNGQCCPRASPNYTYGGHGYQAGCYASCPYVGDCGSSTVCY